MRQVEEEQDRGWKEASGALYLCVKRVSN